MTDVSKGIAAVVAVFIVGFLIVGTSEKSEEEKKNDAMVSGYASMSQMASKKCPAAIKKHMGSPVFFPSETESDKQSYMTLTWKGGKDDKYKLITCTFTRSVGGISELVIDGKTVQSKGIK